MYLFSDLKMLSLKLQFHFGRWERIQWGCGLVNREDGGWLPFLLKLRAPTKVVICRQVGSHGAGPRNCCATGHLHWMFSSAALDHHNSSFHTWPVLAEQIPLAQCLHCQKTNQQCLILFWTCRTFLGHGVFHVFHWDYYWFVSGSYLQTQDSSPGKIRRGHMQCVL